MLKQLQIFSSLLRYNFVKSHEKFEELKKELIRFNFTWFGQSCQTDGICLLHFIEQLVELFIAVQYFMQDKLLISLISQLCCKVF